jgi:hypothetical protein
MGLYFQVKAPLEEDKRVAKSVRLSHGDGAVLIKLHGISERTTLLVAHSALEPLFNALRSRRTP